MHRYYSCGIFVLVYVSSAINAEQLWRQQNRFSTNQPTNKWSLSGIDYSLWELFSNATQSIKDAATQICYGDLGCFSTDAPWSSAGRIAFLPESPEKINVQFLLLSRRNSHDYVTVKAGDKRLLKKSQFDGSKKTKFIVHGYLDWGSHAWLKTMAQQFLIKDDCNVISVDWSGGSQAFYGQACANGRVVGAEIAKMVKYLRADFGLRIGDVHVIGHSLGAHIAGYVGNELGNKLGRITAMDPADPYFQDEDTRIRLDETDAQFVEVLHTDAGSFSETLILRGGFGLWQPSGHIDTYIAGGMYQPGCNDNGPLTSIFNNGIFDGFRKTLGCNHCRAYEYVSESIGSSCPWRSYACQSWKEFLTGRCLRCSDGLNKTCNSVGYRAVKPGDHSANNMYWLMTGEEAPFCRFHYHVQLTITSKTNKEQKGKFWFKLNGIQTSTDFVLATGEMGETMRIKPGQTYDFLITSASDLGSTLKSVEIKWQHDAAWLDITQWQFSHPTIYPQSITAFSGEYQTESSFCDHSNLPLKSESSRNIQTQC